MKALFLSAALVSLQAMAAPTPKIQTQTWTNPDCATGQCDLKAFRLTTEKYKVDRMQGTSVIGEIETTSKDQLKNYVLIQYIKGCVYETNSTGVTRIGTREFWGNKNAPFIHKGFQIDSTDRDPNYWSTPKFGWDELRGFEIPRNGSYSTAIKGGGSWAGKPSNLKESKIFVSDMPTPSAWDLTQDNKLSLRISSLQFRVCIHDVSKVPVTVDDPSTIIPDAIACLDWSSNWAYDSQKHGFVEQKEISPVCL